MRAFTFSLLAMATLAACDGGSEDAGGTAGPAETTASTPTPTPDPAANEAPATEIPAAIRGRWGLVPADCTSTRGDAKGLLTISASSLEFYESVGTLGTISEAGPTRIRASFDFEGEGMNWKRDQVLDVQDDGATLIRREYGEEAAPGPFRYARCN
jgi:hypothetical protein